MVYVKLSSPVNPDGGIYVTVAPLPVIETVPPSAVAVTAVIVSGSWPSGSDVSLSSTSSSSPGESIDVEKESSTASGASATSSTVTVTIAVADAPLPSLTVY